MRYADALYASPDRVTPSVTLFVVYGLGVVGLGLLIAWTLRWMLVHRRRRDAAARAQASADAPLHAGSIVLHGRVIADGDEKPAVRIDLRCVGRESRDKNGNWSHSWSEIQRVVVVRPFTVARDDGTRVRVEPDDRVLLVDKLDRVQDRDALHRVVSAQLDAGEVVYVAGEMQRAGGPSGGPYRDGESTWVLRPAKGQRMLISTEPLADRDAARMRWHGRWLLGLWAFTLLAHGFLFARVHAMQRAQRVDAIVDDATWTRVWVHTKSGGYWRLVSWVEAHVTDDGGNQLRVRDTIPFWLMQDLKEREGQPRTVPFLVRFGRPTLAQLGTTPTADVTRVWIFLIALGLLVAIQAASTVSTRAWYERRYSRSRAGRLPGPALP